MKFLYREMPHLQPIPIKTKGNNFITKIVIWLFSSRKWKLIKNWVFTWEGVDYLIPRGFIFDGASVPRIFWFILSPVGLLLIQGLIHDFGFKYNCLRLNTRKKTLVFEDAGQLFFDNLFFKVGCEINGLPIINGIPWFMLRLFGHSAWNKHRKNEQ